MQIGRGISEGTRFLMPTKIKAVKKMPKLDDFASVAKRLECDPDLKKFDAKLGKIVKLKPVPSTRDRPKKS